MLRKIEFIAQELSKLNISFKYDWDKNANRIIVADYDLTEFDVPYQWYLIRLRRNTKLDESDWTQLLDAPLTTTKQDEWKVYRQSLRDIPQTFASPDKVVWPDEPTT